MKHLILTSTSAIKVQAVREVFPDYEIIGIKTPTEIEQPFGLEQTEKICEGRIKEVEKFLITKLPILSIESGLVEVPGGYVDFVYVVLKSETIYYNRCFTSEGLKIPEEYEHYVTEANQKGFATTTFGEVLNSYNPSIPKDNWQEHLCGISRKDQIKAALASAKEFFVMTEFILTVGISGSGKSTWAEQQDAVIVERDILREQLRPGYWKGHPDNKFENQITQIQRNLLRSLVKAGTKKVIISDTNLNIKHLDSLISYLNEIAPECLIYTKVFYDSLSLNFCLTNNKNRERQVPEDVIVRQWKTFQNLFNSHEYRRDSKTRPIVWVSDIHSQAGKLAELLAKYSPEDYQYIFNGDINDSNLEPLEANFSKDSSFLDTYGLIYDAVETHKAILLHSNHQKNLINLLRGRRKKLGYGLDNTAAELTWLGLEVDFDETDDTNMTLTGSRATTGTLQAMFWWLASRPVQAEFVHNGLTYRCSHAWTHYKSSFEPFPAKDELNIYGPTEGRDRLIWWEERDLLKTPVEVISLVGHYHHVYKGKNCIVYDPNCGRDGGSLGYIVFEDGQNPYFGLV